MSAKTEALNMWPIPENSLQKDPVIDQNAEATAQAMVGIVTRNLIADANYTLLPADYLCNVQTFTDTGVVLTAGRDMIYPALFPRQTVINATAKTLTLKMVGQPGVTLAAATSTTIVAGPTDVIDAAVAGGGGGISDAPSDGTAYNRKDGAWAAAGGGGGGGGDVERIAQVVVTTAQTDIDFSSLDLDADKIYRLEVFVVPNAGGIHNISLSYNADTTVTNYLRQQIYGFGGAAGASATADALIFFTNTLGGTTNPFHFDASIRKAPGAKPLANSQGTTVHNDGSLIWAAHSVRWNDTSNVTSIKLRNSTTNGFGVGTFVRLYRMN